MTKEIMKIFSLQSKIDVITWSLILGLIIDLIFTLYYDSFGLEPLLVSGKVSCMEMPYAELSIKCSQGLGFPLSITGSNYGDMGILFILLVDLLIWFIVFCVILFIIRHFRKPKIPNS